MVDTTSVVVDSRADAYIEVVSEATAESKGLQSPGRCPIQTVELDPVPGSALTFDPLSGEVIDDGQKIVDCQRVFAYISFDVETTGLSIYKDGVTEVGAVLGVMAYIGGKFVDVGQRVPSFQAFCKPRVPIHPKSTEITGITEEHVRFAPTLSRVFQQFIEHCNTHLPKALPRVLLSYNGHGYDVPLVVNDLLGGGGDPNMLLRQLRLDMSVDLMIIARKYLDTTLVLRGPSGRCLFTLGSVYQSVFQKSLEGAHGAVADSEATLDLMLHESFRAGVETELMMFLQSKTDQPTEVKVGSVVFDIDQWTSGLLQVANARLRAQNSAAPGYVRQLIRARKRPAELMAFNI